jgi:ATPase subunit of ABC transporter with duplicated ATPase domains
MLVSCENVYFGFCGNSLLENICFTLSEGDRVGLIGANGEGKTTLLRLILSELDVESGTLFKKAVSVSATCNKKAGTIRTTPFGKRCALFLPKILKRCRICV